MIVLVTDFGLRGPYVGQLKAVCHQDAPGHPIVDLFHTVPAYDIRACAYLLAAYVDDFPPESVFLSVVDPGVGTQERRPVVLEADRRWFVGPGNGLFDLVARRAHEARWWEITWKPERFSASFHGRDLFAPIAAAIASAGLPGGRVRPWTPVEERGWPDELYELIYIDSFGNAMAGVRAARVDRTHRLQVRNIAFSFARTFGDVPAGRPLWYENANGLVEFAVNQGSAAGRFGLRVGDCVQVMAGG